MAASSKRKIVIDCDAGLDDAAAILMACASEHVEVVAVTCVYGNTHLDQISTNVLRVLRLCGRLDIAVYRGCCASLLGAASPVTGHHGDDGLGDVPDPDPPSPELVQDKHAVLALLDLVKQYPGEITLVAIGPLTNVAVAIRLQPDFGKQLRNCVIMGGNTEAKGNVAICAEFNTHCDPEAMAVVLQELDTEIRLLPLELCRSYALSWEEANELWSLPSVKSQQMKKWEEKPSRTRVAEKWPRYHLYDQIAMAVAINEAVVQESHSVYATVELSGKHTRGQLVWDWNGSTQHKPNVHLPTKLDRDLLKKLLHKAYAD